VHDLLFIGNAYCSVDAMGRVKMPQFVQRALARRSAGSGLFLSRHDLDLCLISYDRSAAARMEEDNGRRRQGEAGWLANPAYHARLRRAYGFALSLTLDSKSRMTLPPLLRQVGKIGGSALVIGAGDTFEIWNPEMALESGDAALGELARFHLDQKQAA
jgi:MraZ protein